VGNWEEWKEVGDLSELKDVGRWDFNSGNLGGNCDWRGKFKLSWDLEMRGSIEALLGLASALPSLQRKEVFDFPMEDNKMGDPPTSSGKKPERISARPGIWNILRKPESLGV